MITAVVSVSNQSGFESVPLGMMAIRKLKWVFILIVIIFFTQLSAAQAEEDEPFFEIEFDKSELFLPCPSGCVSDAGRNACRDDAKRDISVTINQKQKLPGQAKIWFEYAPETGSVSETENGLSWDLGDAVPGVHWLKVKMNQGFETIDALSKSVEVGRCDCSCEAKCAILALEAETPEVIERQVVMLRAIQTGFFAESVRLIWEVENGEVLSGQGSNIVRVRANESGKGDLKVKLESIQPSIECGGTSELKLPILADNENHQ